MLRTLARSSVAYGSAQIVARGAQVATLLVLPALLPPADYGALQLVVTIAVVANFVMPLEITQGVARFYPEAEPDERASYAASAWWFTVAGVFTWAAAALLLAPWGTGLLFGDPRFLPAYRLGVLFVAANALFFFVQNQFRWSFDIRGYLLASITFAAATAGLTLGLGWTWTPALVGALLGQVGGALLAAAIGAVRLRATLLRAPRWDRVQELLRFSLPLVPAQIALFTSLYLGRLVLNGSEGLREVGLFTFASQIAGVASLLMVGVSAAIAPLIMAHHAEPETPPLLARLFEGFVACALLLALGLGLFAPELVALLGRDDYAPAAPLVMIVTAAAMASQLYIFAPGYAVAKRTDRQLWVSLAGATMSVLANMLLITKFGIHGAAWASLLSALAFLFAWWRGSQRFYPVPVRWLRVAACCAAAGAIAALAALWPMSDPPVAIKSASLLIFAVLAVALGAIPRAILLSMASNVPARARAAT